MMRRLSLSLAFAVTLASCSEAPDPTYRGRKVSEWVALTNDRDRSTAMQARVALRELGAPAIPHLIEALGSGEDGMAFAAEETLGMACPDLLPQLREAQQRSSGRRARAIGEAIRSIEQRPHPPSDPICGGSRSKAPAR